MAHERENGSDLLEQKGTKNKRSRDALKVSSLGWGHCKEVSNKSVLKIRPGHSKTAKLSLFSFAKVVHNS